MRLYSITSNIRFTFCLLLLCGPFFSWAQFCGTDQYHRYLSEKYLIEDEEIEKKEPAVIGAVDRGRRPGRAEKWHQQRVGIGPAMQVAVERGEVGIPREPVE